MSDTHDKPKILFLSANPLNEPSIRVDQELREIREQLERSGLGEAFELVFEPATRVKDLIPLILRHKPAIVHLSCHGDRKGQLILEYDDGNAKPVDKASLALAFATLSKYVRCVVLNACSSAEQALEIAKHVEFVVGMGKSIGDRAAIGFSSNFYLSLADKQSLQESFDLGKAGAGLQESKDLITPELYLRADADPGKGIFENPQ